MKWCRGECLASNRCGSLCGLELFCFVWFGGGFTFCASFLRGFVRFVIIDVVFVALTIERKRTVGIDLVHTHIYHHRIHSLKLGVTLFRVYAFNYLSNLFLLLPATLLIPLLHHHRIHTLPYRTRLQLALGLLHHIRNTLQFPFHHQSLHQARYQFR